MEAGEAETARAFRDGQPEIPFPAGALSSHRASCRSSESSAGQGESNREPDEECAGETVHPATDSGSSPQPSTYRAGKISKREKDDEREQRKAESKPHHLRAHRPLRIHELRQEGKEEESDLRIDRVGDESPHEEARGGFCGCNVEGRTPTAQGADAEIEKVSRTREL